MPSGGWSTERRLMTHTSGEEGAGHSTQSQAVVRRQKSRLESLAGVSARKNSKAEETV